MPPCPIRPKISKWSSLYPPWRFGRCWADGTGGPSRKVSGVSAEFKSDRTSRRSSASSGQASFKNSARSSGGCSSPASNNSSRRFQVLGIEMPRFHLVDPDFALQPGFGEFPVANNSVRVYLKRFGDFLHSHTAEIA